MYAQPVRVVTNTLSDHYDQSLSNIGGGGYSTDSIWNNCRNGRNSTRTIGTTNNNNNNKTSSSSKSRHHHDSYHNNDRRHNNNGTISGGQSSSTGIHYPSYVSFFFGLIIEMFFNY